MKYLIILIFLTSMSLQAKSKNIQTKYGTITVTPVVTFENAQKLKPTPHVKQRTLYGVRATWSHGILALEGEYTMGSDSDFFVSTGKSIKENVKKAKLGLRASFSLNSMLSWSLRGGAQAKQSLIEETLASVTTSNKGATYVDPYIGTELSIHLFNLFSLSAGVTAVMSDYPNKGKIETSTDFGVSFHY